MLPYQAKAEYSIEASACSFGSGMGVISYSIKIFALGKADPSTMDVGFPLLLHAVSNNINKLDTDNKVKSFLFICSKIQYDHHRVMIAQLLISR